MERAKIVCETFSKGKFSKRIALRDIRGKEITGFAKAKDRYIQVNVIENHGDKIFVLLPKGLNKETAWIDSKYLK